MILTLLACHAAPEPEPVSPPDTAPAVDTAPTTPTHTADTAPPPLEPLVVTGLVPDADGALVPAVDGQPLRVRPLTAWERSLTRTDVEAVALGVEVSGVSCPTLIWRSEVTFRIGGIEMHQGAIVPLDEDGRFGPLLLDVYRDEECSSADQPVTATWTVTDPCTNRTADTTVTLVLSVDPALCPTP